MVTCILFNMISVEHTLMSWLFSPQDMFDGSTTPAITLAELRSSHQGSLVSQDLEEAFKREKRLKARVQELVVTLEKLSRNSEIRHQQSAEFVNDLKRANRWVKIKTTSWFLGQNCNITVAKTGFYLCVGLIWIIYCKKPRYLWYILKYVSDSSFKVVFWCIPVPLSRRLRRPRRSTRARWKS